MVTRRSGLALGFLLLLACSSSSTAALPTSCNQSDRHGMYVVHFETVSGTCGPMSDTLVNTGATTGCTVTSETWSESNCRVARTLTCTASDGTVTKLTANTRQQTQDGSVIKGEATFDTQGASSACIGTYNLTYTRVDPVPDPRPLPSAHRGPAGRRPGRGGGRQDAGHEVRAVLASARECAA